MTTTLEQPTAPPAAEPRDPAELVCEETFAKLAEYAVEHLKVHRTYAREGVGQALVLLKAMCDNPGVRLVPDTSVDEFWHIFLMHTLEYSQFCRDHNSGVFLHHVPYIDVDITSGAAMQRTIPLLHATGYRVLDPWWGTGASCCPPDPGCTHRPDYA